VGRTDTVHRQSPGRSKDLGLGRLNNATSTSLNTNTPRPQSLQLALLYPLEQHLAVRIRVHSNLVQRVQLARTVEHILVHLSVLASKTAIQHPVVKAPRIYQLDSMRPDLLEQLHDRVGARELDLVLAARA
jgi:hypothetical protein